MVLHRREFLNRVAASGLALLSSANKAAGSGRNIKAIAFDGFPILDPRPVFALVDELYPERGVELSNVWRSRQFEYTWLRTMSRRYALVFAAKTLKVELTPEKHSHLMDAYLKLRCWPDVPAALGSLESAGIRLAILSNLIAKMLETGTQNSQLEGMFDHLLSTDRVKVYKPDPRVSDGRRCFWFETRPNRLRCFAGWDAAGAKSFWVSYQELGAAPDATGGNLNDLVAWLSERKTHSRE